VSGSAGPPLLVPALEGVLRDRTVVVTGGSMGIGYACAAAVLAAGGRVVIAARGSAELTGAAERLGAAAASGPGAADRVLAQSCDVADADAVARLFDQTEAAFGRVDGVIHAAAVIGPIGSVLEVDPGAWLETVRIDLFGCFLVLRTAAERMREGGGRIVLLSGGGATAAFPNYSAYASSKAGVVRLAETAARELAHYDIAVNALAPGFVATRMHEATLEAGERAGADYLERTRQELAAGGVPPETAARAALFLVSPASAGISGRLFAAPWDDMSQWAQRVPEIAESDVFTLRRIVPRDRGADWQ
jgi:NAD(P)-dependent dehydrogenase (short-subunit alcohol dehydrogenase family)